MMALYTFRSARTHFSIASRYGSAFKVLVVATDKKAFEKVEQRLAQEGFIGVGQVKCAKGRVIRKRTGRYWEMEK